MTKNEIVVSSMEYQEASNRFRLMWTEYNLAEENVKTEIITMVKALEKDDGMTRTQALQKIADDHRDLKGFSRRTIYRQIPQDMKSQNIGRPISDKLVQPNMSNDILVQPNNNEKKEYKGLKNFRESKGVQEINNIETLEMRTTNERDEVEQTYDPQFVDNLVKANAQYEELITPFESRVFATVKGQEIPFIVKVDPYKRIVTSLEVDEKEAKKLNKK